MSKGKGGKADAMSILTNQNVIMGAGVGVGVGIAIDKFLGNTIKNPMLKMVISAIAPAFISGMVLKNRDATIAAAGFGVGVAGASMASTMLKPKSNNNALPSSGKTAMIDNSGGGYTPGGDYSNISGMGAMSEDPRLNGMQTDTYIDQPGMNGYPSERTDS
jgi:hypothetical protein